MQRVMRHYRLITVLALLWALAGCGATPPPNLTPQATAAFHARRALDVLRVIRDTAVDASRQTPPLISHKTAIHVVTWHKSLVQAIGAVPSGVRNTVDTALVQLKADIPPEDWKRIENYVNLLRAVIAEVT